MSWHKIELSQIQVVNGLEIQIQNEFESLFESLGYMKDFALFHSKMPSKASIIYISPVASENAKMLILKYGGQSCSAPYSKDVFPWIEGSRDFRLQ